MSIFFLALGEPFNMHAVARVHLDSGEIQRIRFTNVSNQLQCFISCFDSGAPHAGIKVYKDIDNKPLRVGNFCQKVSCMDAV